MKSGFDSPARFLRKQIIDHLRELTEELGHHPTYREYENSDGPSMYQLNKEFESFNAAKEAAGLGTNTPTAERPVPLRTHERGYERWMASDGTEDGKVGVYVHRLFAVAIYGFDAVKDNHVHHENHITWDTREDNITLESPEDHARIHRRAEA